MFNFDPEKLQQELSKYFPYVACSTSHLGGGVSLFIKLSITAKEDWPCGIFQNSPYAVFVIHHNEGVWDWSKAKIEMLSRGLNVPKFRKTRVGDVVNKLCKWKCSFA